MADFYEILGVPRDADADTIKRAYRRLAMEHHPDRNQGSSEAEEQFKKITRAYDVLRDPEKRSSYDRFGERGVGGGGGGTYGGFDFSDALEIFMRDFGGFGGFEGGRQSRGAREAGSNIRVRLSLSLAEVASGVAKTIRVSVLETCGTCTGSGAAPGSAPVTCSTCNGSGQERIAQRSVFGQFVSVMPCRRCAGEGRVIEQPCVTCRGDGRVRREKNVEVEVPAGVGSDNYLTMRGSGNVGPRGGPAGDLLVLFEVEEDSRFTRDGANLLHDLAISFGQAALGDRVEVPTVDGVATVTVPSGIQSGTVLRLRGHGLPQLDGRGRGDQMIRVHVWTPERLSSEQEKVMIRLRELEDAPPVPSESRERKGFWSRVKEALT
jgi:molecular chaperone DnaJ